MAHAAGTVETKDRRVTGKPFDIAPCALLLRIPDRVTGIEPDDPVHLTGDAHVCSRLPEQVCLRLSRLVKTPLRRVIRRGVGPVFCFRYGSFRVIGYEPDPAIRAPLAHRC